MQFFMSGNESSVVSVLSMAFLILVQSSSSRFSCFIRSSSFGGSWSGVSFDSVASGSVASSIG